METSLSNLKVKPVGHRIMIDPDYQSKEIQEGALKGFITTTNEDTYEREKAMTQIGRVVAIGPTAWKPEGLGGGIPWCEVGDLIYFARHAQKIVKDGEKEYFIINDEDVQCIVEEYEPDFLEG